MLFTVQRQLACIRQFGVPRAGFHLVDSKQRMIVVEGLVDQAMQALIVQVRCWGTAFDLRAM